MIANEKIKWEVGIGSIKGAERGDRVAILQRWLGKTSVKRCHLSKIL